MKRLAALLIAATCLLSLPGLIGPAVAAPSPKVSARLSISSDCIATVHVSWSGIPAEWQGLTVQATIQGAGSDYAQKLVNLPGTRGKTIVTFTGVPRDGDAVSNVVVVQGGGLADTASKTAACTWAAS